MFEIGWSELLILGVVTLLLVGPKDLPAFMRTVGRYAGIVRRHAAEFRVQFDAALREAELEAMKKDMDDLGRTMQGTLRDAANGLPKEPAASAPGSSPIPSPDSASASGAAPPETLALAASNENVPAAGLPPAGPPPVAAEGEPRTAATAAAATEGGA